MTLVNYGHSICSFQGTKPVFIDLTAGRSGGSPRRTFNNIRLAFTFATLYLIFVSGCGSSAEAHPDLIFGG